MTIYTRSEPKPVIIAGGGPSGIFHLLSLAKKGIDAELYEASGIIGGAPAIGGHCYANRPASFNWGDEIKPNVLKFWETHDPEININEFYAPRSILFQAMLTHFVEDAGLQSRIHLNSPVQQVWGTGDYLTVKINDVEQATPRLILATGHQPNAPVHEAFKQKLGSLYYKNPWLSDEQFKGIDKGSSVLLLGGSNGAVDMIKRAQELGREDLSFTIVTADGAGFRPLTMDNLKVNMGDVHAELARAETAEDVAAIFNWACQGSYNKGEAEDKNINPFIVQFSKAVRENCNESLKRLSDRFIKMAGRIISPHIMEEMKTLGQNGQVSQLFGYVKPENIGTDEHNKINVSGLSSDLPSAYLRLLDTLDVAIFPTSGDQKFDLVVNTSPYVRGMLLDDNSRPINGLFKSAVDSELAEVTRDRRLISIDPRLIIANPSLERDTLFSVARSIEMAQRI